MKKVLFGIKKILTEKKYYRRFKVTVAALLVVALVTCLFVSSYANRVNEDLAGNIIRLHVIANSNTADDQDLKLKVRDAVLNYMKEKLEGSTGIEESISIVKENLDNIKSIAVLEIERYKKDYPVNLSLGNYPFPTKEYGDVALPAGNYQALRIVIGKGEGANWWCVLFPPLCFVDATHGSMPDSVKEKLKESLTEEDYGIITSVDSSGDIPVKIKFKLVEVFQGSKVKVSGIFTRLFR